MPHAPKILQADSRCVADRPIFLIAQAVQIGHSPPYPNLDVSKFGLNFGQNVARRRHRAGIHDGHGMRAAGQGYGTGTTAQATGCTGHPTAARRAGVAARVAACALICKGTTGAGAPRRHPVPCARRGYRARAGCGGAPCAVAASGGHTLTPRRPVACRGF